MATADTRAYAVSDPASHERLVAALRRALGGDEQVALVQTHISSVLVTDTLAYKLKKPVALGFLDFSSLEKRRRACEDELRLNRRFAPALYLDVVPLTGTLEDVAIGGEGPAIEYAVRMRAFAQDALGSAAIARGALTPAHIDALALRVRRLPRPRRRHGSAGAVWHPRPGTRCCARQLPRSRPTAA